MCNFIVVTSNLIVMKHWTFVDENLTRFQTIANILRTNNRSGRICASRPELGHNTAETGVGNYICYGESAVSTLEDDSMRSLTARRTGRNGHWMCVSPVFLELARFGEKCAGDIHGYVQSEHNQTDTPTISYSHGKGTCESSLCWHVRSLKIALYSLIN